MPEFYAEGTPPSVIALADAMVRAIVETGIDPEAAMVQIENLTPAVMLGCAAIAITGESDIREATRTLFDDKSLHEQIVSELGHPLLQISVEETLIDIVRLGELREIAKGGSINVKDLKQNEVIRLEYARDRRRSTDIATIVASRPLSGKSDDKQYLFIHETEGELLGPMGNKVRKGQIYYMGFVIDERHEPMLQRSTTPAWVTGVHKAKGEWVYDNLYKANGYILQQVYFGDGTEYPLFPVAIQTT